MQINFTNSNSNRAEKICAQLYDITNENYKSGTGKDLFFPRSAILQAFNQTGLSVDVAPLISETSEELLHSIYSLCFYRSVDTPTYEAYLHIRTEKSEIELKKWVLSNARYSSEFFDRGGYFLNDPFYRHTLYGNTLYQFRKFIKRMYHSMVHHFPWIKSIKESVCKLFKSAPATIWTTMRNEYHKIARRHPAVKKFKEHIRKSESDWETEENNA